MTKNKELTYLILIDIMVIIITSALIDIYQEYRVWISVLSGILLLIIYLLFSRYRYHKIKEFSSIINEVLHGNYTLNLNSYEEGELSYLQNVLYKVTLRLTEQSELLLKDKVYLANTLSDISHQLKTPLTSMMVMSDLLNDDTLPSEKREEFTANIRKQLERIDWLVTTLLKMSKLDAGSITLKKESVLVSELVRSATSHLLIPIELMEQELIIEGDESTSYIGDFSWSNEAVTNIVKNCMEHTPSKGTLKISYGHNNIYTFIRISDNGQGIDPEDLPNIFKRFYKGRNSNPGSVGIGLSISHQIITAQNGIIEVSSQKGEETTFLIKFYSVVV